MDAIFLQCWKFVDDQWSKCKHLSMVKFCNKSQILLQPIYCISTAPYCIVILSKIISSVNLSVLTFHGIIVGQTSGAGLYHWRCADGREVGEKKRESNEKKNNMVDKEIIDQWFARYNIKKTGRTQEDNTIRNHIISNEARQYERSCQIDEIISISNWKKIKKKVK